MAVLSLSGVIHSARQGMLSLGVEWEKNHKEIVLPEGDSERETRYQGEQV
jgi:hypothetical protein